MNYEELLKEADNLGLITKEMPLSASDGRIRGNRIAIRKNLPTAAHKACVLAEELGHHATTVGDIVDQQYIPNRKQELRARTWAYDKMISLMGIVKAYRAGCTNSYEMAEYLEVTEEFFCDALNRYRSIYGIGVQAGGYTIIFEPELAIIKLNN